MNLQTSGPRSLARLRICLALLVIGFFIFLVGACVLAQEGSCPIESVAGQVQGIVGPPNEVILVRQNDPAPLRVHKGICILLGDRLDASQVDKVTVITPRVNKRPLGVRERTWSGTQSRKYRECRDFGTI
jgi:hypothetical protein